MFTEESLKCARSLIYHEDRQKRVQDELATIRYFAAHLDLDPGDMAGRKILQNVVQRITDLDQALNEFTPIVRRQMSRCLSQNQKDGQKSRVA